MLIDKLFVVLPIRFAVISAPGILFTEA